MEYWFFERVLRGLAGYIDYQGGIMKREREREKIEASV